MTPTIGIATAMLIRIRLCRRAKQPQWFDRGDKFPEIFFAQWRLKMKLEVA
jgi:hypothetical protein